MLKLRIVPSTKPAIPPLEPEHLLDLVAENAGLRAALAMAEDASIRRELVSQELKHRIGNLIAVVQAIARKTFRDANIASVQDFTARLGALAAAQALLIDAETRSATLLYVVQHALAAHASNGNQFTLIGPNVVLAGRQAHALTMALHELATNAVKYGALSNENGVVEIEWTIGDGQLIFVWRERGGPSVGKPLRTGFGTSLVTINLQAAFAGTVDLSFDERGVECRLQAPLPLRA